VAETRHAAAGADTTVLLAAGCGARRRMPWLTPRPTGWRSSTPLGRPSRHRRCSTTATGAPDQRRWRRSPRRSGLRDPPLPLMGLLLPATSRRHRIAENPPAVSRPTQRLDARGDQQGVRRLDGLRDAVRAGPSPVDERPRCRLRRAQHGDPDDVPGCMRAQRGEQDPHPRPLRRHPRYALRGGRATATRPLPPAYWSAGCRPGPRAVGEAAWVIRRNGTETVGRRGLR
jgi:hypothetical protein